ncbi:MAG: lipid II:glycine glycyltransferase FemX [Candidatus Limnocylindrus sp.]|jgi:peptidoglycan pentaglycine glycine transferase (the first glycine)
MSDKIEALREEPDAWGARLVRAYAAGEIDELPFTQTAAWAASKQLTGWSSTRLIAQHPSGAWAGAQLLLQRLPGPLGRFAYAPRAPLVACADPGVADALRTELLRGLRSLRADGVTLVRLEPGSSLIVDPESNVVQPDPALTASLRALWISAATGAGARLHLAAPIQPPSSRRIALRGGVEAVRAGWRSKWRQYARQALTDGVTVRLGSVDELPALSTVMRAISERTGSKARSGEAFAQLMRAFGPRSELLIAEGADARGASELLGALLVVRTESGSTELFGGATDRGNELRAPYALKAFAIERAVDQGSTWYDMWGLVTPGIAHFKAGWGGDVHAYPGALDLDLDPIRGPLVRLALRVRRVAS